MHTVLILTNDSDRTADRVAAELALRGVPVIRLDPSEFPRYIAMSARIGTGRTWTGELHTRAGQLDLSTVEAVYRRRPSQFALDESMTGPERAFAYGEARRGFGGVLAGSTTR